jgi:hypothetical protein
MGDGPFVTVVYLYGDAYLDRDRPGKSTQLPLTCGCRTSKVIAFRCARQAVQLRENDTTFVESDFVVFYCMTRAGADKLNGRGLAGWSEYRRSTDGGRTWGEPVVFHQHQWWVTTAP